MKARVAVAIIKEAVTTKTPTQAPKSTSFSFEKNCFFETDAQSSVAQKMAGDSPLKSGPPTVKKQAYDSPAMKDLNSEMTSSMKKHVVPPLDFNKVFE